MISKKMSNGGENLPPECWQLIFNHLSGGDLKAISLVCKSFLTNSNLVRKSLTVVHPKAGMLSQHLKRFTQLKKVDLSYFKGDLDEALCQIARSDVSLESLDVSWPNASFETESLRELAANPKMRNLKALMTWMPIRRLQDNDLQLIANWFPNLEELEIDCWSVLEDDTLLGLLYIPADDGIECLESNLKNLKKISIYGPSHSVSDRALVALAVNCIYLKDVTISSVTESCIGHLIRKMPSLESLTIGDIKNDPSSTITIANSISHATALTSLEFINMDVSDEICMAIAKAKFNLENFGFSGYRNNFTVTGLLMVLSNYLTKLSILGANFSDEDIKLLSSGDVGNLTHIAIGNCQVTNSTLFLLLSKCPSLVELSISMNSRALYVPIGNADNNIPLSKYHKIRNLELSFWTISDELVLAKQLGFSFPNIKLLALSFCDGLTSICIEAILQSCKYITQLILKGYKKGKIIEVNSELPGVNLEVLSLQFSCIDDEGLAVIGTKCPKLVNLDLSFCKNVTTKSIKQIVQNIKTLTCLDLSSYYENQIDYGDLLEWMLSTGNFASLKKLSLGKVAVTEEQREQFLHHGCLVSYVDMEEKTY